MIAPRDRDWLPHADNIIEACGKVRRYLAGMTYEAFEADDLTRDAVIRNLEVIGGAAGKLPKEVTESAPQIPWRRIGDMRDRLATGYFDVSLKVVWDTATTQVDELEKAVRALLA
jgi:uncharacterized protein with HEPN domain